MTATLGLRFSSKDYTYMILSGSKVLPVVVEHDTIKFPSGYSKPHRLRWVYQEIEEICEKHKPKSIGIKGDEGVATRGAAFVEKTEMEAVVFLVSYNLGIKQIDRKVKNTLAKDLGMKGKAKYLNKLDYSCIPGFADYSKNEQEALLAAWSQLG